jgi:polar amino acid transport system permease protein
MTILQTTINSKRFSRFSDHFGIIKYILTIGALVWLLFRGTTELGYNWQWYRILKYVFYLEAGGFIAGPLIQGLFVTFKITAISLVLACIIGLIAAVFRLSDSVVARMLARGYLELIRSTPLLVQLFFFYFVLSPVFNIGRFSSAVLALSLFEGAYASEIFRAGIVSIPKGQWEAAGSLGLGVYYTYRHIILPQALRWVLPPLTSQAISLVKDSALVSTIAIYDLTMQGQAIVSDTYMVFEVWFVVALIYLIVTTSMSIGVHALERHLKIKS